MTGYEVVFALLAEEDIQKTGLDQTNPQPYKNYPGRSTYRALADQPARLTKSWDTWSFDACLCVNRPIGLSHLTGKEGSILGWLEPAIVYRAAVRLLVPPPTVSMDSCVVFQASLWRESGHSYSPWQAKSTRQVLVRLGGRHGRVYSYPADKVSHERRFETSNSSDRL